MLWENVQNILDDKSMTIYRLSRETGINENTLYSYSRGISEPSFKNMVKIADALDVSLDTFREEVRKWTTLPELTGLCLST